MVCSGERVPSEAALAAGLIDEEVDGDLRAAAVARARELAGRKQRLRDRPVPAADAAAVAAAAAAALKAGKTPAGGAGGDRRRHRRRPRRHRRRAWPTSAPLFQRLRVSREAVALRHQFFAERDSAKHPSLDGAAPRAVQRIAVIGAGTMGSGIAIAALDAGYEVLLLEQDADALERGADRIHAHYAGRVQAGKIKASGRGGQRSAAEHQPGLAAHRRGRPGDRSGVRGAGGQAAGLPAHRRAGAAGRGAGVQHLVPGPGRHRRGHVAPAGRDRPALLQPGQRDEADGSRARRALRRPTRWPPGWPWAAS